MTREEINEVLAGVKILVDQQKTDIMTMIENGVQKDVRLLAEKVLSLDNRMGKVEQDLSAIKEDTAVIRAAVTHHQDEIFQLKRIIK